MCASYPQEIEFADYTMRSCRENSDFSAFFGSMQSEIQYEDDSYHPVQMDLVQQMRFRSENDSESASPNMSTPNRDPLFVLNFNDDDFEEETDVVIQPSERLFGQLSRLTANGDYPIYGCDKIYAIESEANAFVLNEKGELIPQLRDSEQNTEISILPIFQRKKPLPLLYEAEPIYVNARQYDRILKLRIKRAIAGKIKGPDYVFLQPRSVK